MKVLVLAQNYPDNNGCVTLMYIHTRNQYYIENGLDVTVLNFTAQVGYKIDGINVIALSEYEESASDYDLLILHAANLRNHLKFIKKYGDRFPKFLFFYHGHEVMRINRDYAPPYEYMKEGKVKSIIQDIYDEYKLRVWRTFLPKVIHKSYFIFVSNWMKDTFVKNVRIPTTELENKYCITYNSVGKDFEALTYDSTCSKEFDFVTIRANLDGSKYAVDIVNRLAKNTPSAKFLIVGKGSLFDHIQKADNVTWLNKTMSHDEIVDTLNACRFALMPTRTDAQGLMMCEMAAFGIPVITSDIPVCHEVFDGFENAFFISNDDENASLSEMIGKTIQIKKDNRYYHENTIQHELKAINELGRRR